MSEVEEELVYYCADLAPLRDELDRQYRCTLPRGHEGDHIAHVQPEEDHPEDRFPVAIWDRSTDFLPEDERDFREV